MKIYSGWFVLILIFIGGSLTVTGCQPTVVEARIEKTASLELQKTLVVEQPSAETPLVPTIEFSLLTAVGGGRITYLGVGGEIDGVTNPDLNVQLGDVVSITLTNGDSMPHDLAIPEFNVKTSPVVSNGDQIEVIFEVKDQPAGDFAYFCTFPGHRQAGQEGLLVVTAP